MIHYDTYDTTLHGMRKISEPKIILKMIPGEEFHQNRLGNKCKVVFD